MKLHKRSLFNTNAVYFQCRGLNGMNFQLVAEFLFTAIITIILLHIIDVVMDINPCIRIPSASMFSMCGTASQGTHLSARCRACSRCSALHRNAPIYLHDNTLYRKSPTHPHHMRSY